MSKALGADHRASGAVAAVLDPLPISGLHIGTCGDGSTLLSRFVVRDVGLHGIGRLDRAARPRVDGHR